MGRGLAHLRDHHSERSSNAKAGTCHLPQLSANTRLPEEGQITVITQDDLPKSSEEFLAILHGESSSAGVLVCSHCGGVQNGVLYTICPTCRDGWLRAATWEEAR